MILIYLLSSNLNVTNVKILSSEPRRFLFNFNYKVSYDLTVCAF